jgi:hypothetical protein
MRLIHCFFRRKIHLLFFQNENILGIFFYFQFCYIPPTNVHSQRKTFQGEEHKKSVCKQEKSFYMMKWNLF